jgi:hypothetical protein
MIIKFFINCFVFILLASCGAMFNSKKQKVMIDSNIHNAKIYIDGKDVGVTPQQIELLTSDEPNIRLEKEGYRNQYTYIDKGFKFSANSSDTKWCVISILLWFPVGSLIDFATDSCFVGYKTSYFIEMYEDNNVKK